jgi:hypothetical protein
VANWWTVEDEYVVLWKHTDVSSVTGIIIRDLASRNRKRNFVQQLYPILASSPLCPISFRSAFVIPRNHIALSLALFIIVTTTVTITV